MIPPTDKTGSLHSERRRDNQQWMLDWMVKTTGRTHNFAYDHREIPPEVKTYRQIPRVMEKAGRHQEGIARAAEAAGHRQSACELYYKACENYRIAQHAIFVDDHPDKIYLHGKLIESFAGCMRTADYPIERVEIDWEGVQIQCNFHKVPGGSKLPTILSIPGMDQTKEAVPDPSNNLFIKRGMLADPLVADWLKDALRDKKPRDLNKVVFVHDRTGTGPYSAPISSTQDVYLGKRIEI